MSAQDYIRLAGAMREDSITRCLGSIFFLGKLLFMVGIIWYALDKHNGVSPYLILLACAMWLLLICCGWTVRSSMNPFSNLPTCLCCSFILAIVLGLVVFSAFLLRAATNSGNRVNFDVSEAALTHFNISGDNTGSTLNYDLEVKLTVGPNKKKAGVYYESVQAWASYQGLNFTSLSLPPFYLGGKDNYTSNSSTVVLQTLVFQGQQELVLPAHAFKRYQQDEAAGRFSIDVTVSYLGFRGPAAPGHGRKLMGVKTFALTELPLPNAPSGLMESVDSLSERLAGDGRVSSGVAAVANIL